MEESRKVEKKEGRKDRESNIELFRIITMLLIIAHHYVVNSGLMEYEKMLTNPLSWCSAFLWLFGAWGKTGINCFVLITGYFMCKAQITLKKFLKLFFEIMFYRIIIYLIFLVSGYNQFTLKGFIKTIIPIIDVRQGFTSCYLLFFLCIPFLNILIKGMSEKMHVLLISLLAVIYVLFETVPFFSVEMNYVSWFCVVYLIAAYLRLYPKKIFSRKAFWGIASFVSFLISCLSVVCCAWIGSRIGRNITYTFVSDSNTLLAIINGICWFMYFRNIKIKTNRFINLVASATFGVLLIHANSDTMINWLWKDLLNNVAMYSSNWLIVHAICSVVGIFIVCVIIDLLRQYCIEKPILKKLEKKL